MKKRITCAIVVAVALIANSPVHAQSAPPPPSVADVKMLAKGGISDEVILSQIRSSHAVYHLSTADILDLKDSGASQKVIDFMINTASSGSPPPPASPAMAPAPPPNAVSSPPPSSATPVQEAVEGAAPPAVIVEVAVSAPGPEYVWVAGAWVWHHHHWEWVRGHWVLPPYRGAVWIEGRWDHRWGRVVWIDGYWR